MVVTIQSGHNIRIHGHMDRQMDKWTDRQADKVIPIYTLKLKFGAGGGGIKRLLFLEFLIYALGTLNIIHIDTKNQLMET